LSRAKKVIFKHNDLDDLAKKIRENDLPNKLIVTEGVFSLEGEIINLPKYVELAQKTNSKLMVDDAHGVGILGKTGGGVPELFGCAEGVDLIMGSLDKAFGSVGGYLCGSKELIRFLKVSSRSSILSSAFPIPIAGGVLRAISLVRTYGEERTSLFEKAGRVKHQLNRIGLKTMGEETLPAIAILTGKDKVGISFSEFLWRKGIMCPVFRWPAVAENNSRLRLTIMKSHTKEHLDKLLEVCQAAGKELGFVG
jgi:7-keto-8-aminopelargonate synthetase-like enzyme